MASLRGAEGSKGLGHDLVGQCCHGAILSCDVVLCCASMDARHSGAALRSGEENRAWHSRIAVGKRASSVHGNTDTLQRDLGAGHGICFLLILRR